MKKYLLTVLICLGLAAVMTGAICARPASAAEGDGAQYKLLLPENYEQFIYLSDPTDFAIDESYIAIADKPSATQATIYIYSQAENIYKKYTSATSGEFSSLNLYRCDEGDFLLFIETGNVLHGINLSTMQSADLTWNSDSSSQPSVMQLSGDEVYYTIQTGDTSSLYHATIDGLTITVTTQTPVNLASSKPAFALYGGTVYVSAGNSVFRCSPTGTQPGYTVTDAIEYFAVIGPGNNDILYTNAGGRLYRGSAAQPFRDNCSTIKQYGSNFYVLSGIEILRYNTSMENFDNYCIGKYSDAQNRLGADAQDISLYGSTLLIADSSNDRILFYDTSLNNFTAPVQTNYTPVLLCAGENSFAASDGHALYIYSYGDTVPALSVPASAFSSQIIEIAYSYGDYYIVTGGNNNACILPETPALLGKNELVSGSISQSPTSVTVDIYGNIYVASGGEVYRYTSEEFGKGGTGELACAFPEEPLKILSDYEGNIYCLTNDTIYRYEQGTQYEISSFAFGQTFDNDAFLYSEDSLLAFSFALGYEDDTLYILSDGFVVKTDLGESAPASLKNLSSAELRGALSASTPENAADDILVTVPEGSVLLVLDDTNLAESNAPSVLSYTGYLRTEEARTGVRICTSEAGTVVAFYRYDEDHSFDVTYPDGTQNTVSATLRDYSLCLVLNEQPAAAGGYEENGYTAYLSNDVGLYRFPLMSLLTERDADNPLQVTENPVTAAQLSKGSRVNVPGTLTMPAADGGWGLDSDAYAFVEYEGQYGFVPESYLIPAGEADLTGETSYIWRNLARGESVTLTNVADPSDSVTLSSRERLCVMTAPDENGMVTVSYAADGKEYRGEIDHALLEHPSSALAIAMMVMIPLVAAAVLLSACYLIFRKQPTLQ